MSTNLLTVSPSPHLRQEDTVRSIKTDVLIALTPALVWAAYIFGMRTVILTALSALCGLVFGFVCAKLLKTGFDGFDCVIGGVILAYLLPAGCPLWLPVLGCLVMTAVRCIPAMGSMINPALLGRAVLEFVPGAHNYTKPFEKLPLFANYIQEQAAVLPIDTLNAGVVPQVSPFDLFIGNRIGSIGEVSALLILAGGLYLLTRRIISWQIPAAYFAVIAVFAYLFPRNIFREEYILMQFLCGSAVFCAVFVCGSGYSCPVTNAGKIVFGAGCGLITMLFRYFSLGDGSIWAILIMNLFVPLLDKYLRPRPFGPKTKGAKK